MYIVLDQSGVKLCITPGAVLTFKTTSLSWNIFDAALTQNPLCCLAGSPRWTSLGVRHYTQGHFNNLWSCGIMSETQATAGAQRGLIKMLQSMQTKPE